MKNFEHTQVVGNLLKIGRESRDEKWMSTFLSHVGQAAFACGEPQVIKGPDGFPYFQFFMPKNEQLKEFYVLGDMLEDFLLENGFGIALEPRNNQVEWILSYGDLLHYAIHRTFAIPTSHIFEKSTLKDEVIDGSQSVQTLDPPVYILPVKARKVIKAFLEAQGVKEPKVCLLDRSEEGKGRDLVFNLAPWQFENENRYHQIMEVMGWFLPSYYSYVAIPEAALGEGFFKL